MVDKFANIRINNEVTAMHIEGPLGEDPLSYKYRLDYILQLITSHYSTFAHVRTHNE